MKAKLLWQTSQMFHVEHSGTAALGFSGDQEPQNPANPVPKEHAWPRTPLVPLPVTRLAPQKMFHVEHFAL
jgi:hypothetical protein